MRKLILFALATAALPAGAQTLVEPAGRQGYYVGLGFRNGAFDMIDETAGNLGFMQGGGLALRFGQMAGEQFGFGLVLAFGGGANDTWSGGFSGLQLEGQYVMMKDFALRAAIGVGGLGVARVKPEEKREDDPEGAFGTLYTVGMSYDWFPWWEKGDTSGGLAFTVFADATVLPGDGLFGGGIFLGAEVHWWFGSEDNKLDLGEEAFEN
jgi:hypothetical protein